MAIDDTVQLRFVYRNTRSQNAILVKLFRIRAQTGQTPTLTEIGDSLWQTVDPLIRACIAADWGSYGYKIRQVYPNPTQVLPRPFAVQQGSLLGEILPGQVCTVVSLRASKAPPGSRGRMYLPAPTETESGSGAPLAALLTKADTLAARLLQDFTVNGTAGGVITMRCGLMSKKTNVLFYDFDVKNVRSNFGTQRRRSSINRPDTAEF